LLAAVFGSKNAVNEKKVGGIGADIPANYFFVKKYALIL